jgi:hypothetical protein
VRPGSEDGSLVLGGRTMPIHWRRVRAADKTAELAIPACEPFSSTDVLSACSRR